MCILVFQHVPLASLSLSTVPAWLAGTGGREESLQLGLL
jgi:hypothetical protein